MSSTSSLEHSYIEESSRLDADSMTESTGHNRSQESIQFHEAFFASTTTNRAGSGRGQQQVQQVQQVYSQSSSQQYYQQQQESTQQHQMQQIQQQQLLQLQQLQQQQLQQQQLQQQQLQQQQLQQQQQMQQQRHYHQTAAVKAEEHIQSTTTYYHDHQHFTSTSSSTSTTNAGGYANVQQHVQQHSQPPRSLPQQHVNEQLKQLLAEREFLREHSTANAGGEPPVPTRLQPTTSSNRSMGRAAEQRPVPPPHQPNVFYPVGSGDGGRVLDPQMRGSMRSNPTSTVVTPDGSSSGGVVRSNSSSGMTDSMSSSVVSISSASSSHGPFHQAPVPDWNVEQVGSWLRSIGKFKSPPN